LKDSLKKARQKAVSGKFLLEFFTKPWIAVFVSGTLAQDESAETVGLIVG
jgi:hypothetical protein